MIDLEAKIDEALNRILREKVEEYFNGPKEPGKRVKMAKEPMEAMQKIDNDIKETNAILKGKKLNKRALKSNKLVKGAIEMGCRTPASIAEVAKLHITGAKKVLDRLVEMGEVERTQNGYELTED